MALKKRGGQGMYCPNCRAEYREGFSECADCLVPLVKELPAELPVEFVDFEEVLSTKDPAEVVLIKSLLDSEEIPFIVQGDLFSNIYGHIIPVQFLVDKDKIKEARLLLKDFL